MPPLPNPPLVHSPDDDRGTTSPPACALCGGALLLLRGTVRCCRFGLTLCEGGCEGSAAEG
jgi:hypothetical protein